MLSKFLNWLFPTPKKEIVKATKSGKLYIESKDFFKQEKVVEVFKKPGKTHRYVMGIDPYKKMDTDDLTEEFKGVVSKCIVHTDVGYDYFTDDYVLWLENQVLRKNEKLKCEHTWIHNTHSDTKYCSKGCDGFAIHEAN